MKWSELPLELQAKCEMHLTERELVALKLYVNGNGYGAVARYLGIAKSTARDRIQRAVRVLSADGVIR